MFKSLVLLFVFVLLSTSACGTPAPKPSAMDVNVLILEDSIKIDTDSINAAGDIKFTITNNSGQRQYVIIAPAQCASEEGVSRTPTPECKEKFIEQAFYGGTTSETWEVEIHLEPGDYVVESMVMASGPLQLTKSYFTVTAP